MPTVQNRRGTASILASVNPVLSAGEIAFETDTGRFKLGDGTTAWNSLSYNDSAVGSANQIIFKNSSNVTSGNANLTFNSSTNTLGIQNISLTTNTISTTNTNGNLILGPNGTGSVNVSTNILFPATAVLSTNANTLDDYEEGTFTPTYTCSTTNPTSVTYQANLQIGSYVKIGRLVVYSVRIGISTRSGGTGNLRISGLPFTVSSNNQANYVSTTVSFKSGWTTTGPDGGYTEIGQTYINLTYDNNTVHGMITITNLTAGAVDLMINGTYETDS